LRAAVSITNVISAPETNKATAMTAQVPTKRFKELDQLCQKLGVGCGRMGLVHEALTHSSYAAENPGSRDYEKLEFFGDAVLRFVISEYLLERFPDYDEGKLTELRSVLVSDKVLAEIAEQFNLSKYILLGQKVQMRPSIVAQAMEALIGAIYQDLGLFQVQTLLVRLFGHQTTVVDRDEVKDNYKAQLQEYTQARAEGTPNYVVLGVEGPSHEPIFTVSVEVGGEALAEGSGKSKKQAEQQAAKSAYEKLKERKNSQSRVGQPEPELA
jgi:ribonuclease-3